jgi:hypothetical protein
VLIERTSDIDRVASLRVVCEMRYGSYIMNDIGLDIGGRYRYLKLEFTAVSFILHSLTHWFVPLLILTSLLSSVFWADL